MAPRELRNDNAKVIEAVAAGESCVVTRNGVPVAEVRPIQQTRRTSVPLAEPADLTATGPRIDRERLRADRDRAVDQELWMPAGLLDTSVVTDWDDPMVANALPDEVAVRAITLAEQAAGPHLAGSGSESARRRVRLQQVEAILEPLPFDATAARSYGQIAAAAAETGRSHRRRIADLLTAATAHANGLALHTRNPDDFAGLGDLVHVVGV